MKKIWRTGLLALAICLLVTAMASAQQTKLIALTFDDGPSPVYTPQVLDVLKEKKVSATFFLVGKWMVGKTDLVQREVAEGHEVANHTYDHVKLTTLSDDEISSSLTKTNGLLTQMTGLTGTFMVRPPFGDRNKRVLADLHAPAILWSVDPAAGQQVWSKTMVSRALSKAKDGGIILLHDTTEANLNTVAGVIDGLHEKGFEFVTVAELFRLKGVTPENGVLYQSVTNTNPEGYNESRLSQHWAYGAISDLSARGLMTGDATGWHPNAYLTRAQAVTLLWRISGSPATSHKYSFSDVSAKAYYAAATAWAKDAGIAEGESNGRFLPNNKVTREQLYVMLSRLAAKDGRSAARTSQPVTYGDDARIDSWAKSGVRTIRCMGFSSANDREIFRAKDWATRAEAAELLDWYINLGK